MPKYREYLKKFSPLTKYAKSKYKKEIEKRQTITNNNENSMECAEAIINDASKENTCTVDTKNDSLRLPMNYTLSITNDRLSTEMCIESTDSCNNLTKDGTSMNIFYMRESYNDQSSNEESSDSDDELIRLLENKIKESKEIKRSSIESSLFTTVSVKFEMMRAEILLMALKFGLSTRLPTSGIVTLLKLINRICQKKVVPDTRYFLDRLCSSEINVTYHAVCPVCYNYLGIFKELDCYVQCKKCETSVDTSNVSNPCFFAYLDPSKAIRNTVELHENYYDYIVSERKHKKDLIEDIYDGKLYKDFVKSLPNEDKHAYLTALFNTDGAPVFKSSKFSIWPIYLIPNEIPKEYRMKCSIVCGLYFGRKKPEMNVCLDVFVDNMNHLSKVGIPCTIKKEIRCIKVFPLVACVDSIARCQMNGTNQFNGKCGCDWCLHPGEYYGGSMRYPFLYSSMQERTRNSMLDHAQEAIKNKSAVFGVKYASPLFLLNSFDIIYGFCPEYMHCILAGVVKQYIQSLLNELSKEDIDAIDDSLKKIRAPHHIGRLTRSIREFNNWKAREFENWLLYYSVPVLKPILSKKELDHWLLLVEAVYLCLQSSISKMQLNRANELFYRFVSEMEDRFSLSAMTFNVHQCLHMVKSVYDWGPLWAHSTFPFEAANHYVLTAIHSARGVIPQIIRHLNLQLYVQRLEKEVYPNSTGTASFFCEHILRSRTQKAFKINEILYFGKGKNVKDNMRNELGLSNGSKMYSKVVIHGCLFATSEKINARSCNYFAQLTDETFIRIRHFIVDFDNKKEFTICNIITTRPSIDSMIIKEVVSCSEAACIPTNLIAKICTFITVNETSYIIPVPHMLSY